MEYFHSLEISKSPTSLILSTHRQSKFSDWSLYELESFIQKIENSIILFFDRFFCFFFFLWAVWVNYRSAYFLTSNLPTKFVFFQIREAFSRFGPITNVRLIRDRQTGAVKGIGYVQFDDPSAVSLAIRASRSVSIRSRLVRVEECKPTTSDALCTTGSVGHWKQKRPGFKVTTSKMGIVPTTTRADTKPKPFVKLDQTGKAKGITLPSNLRGSMRERYLAKRLLKKRKRQMRRQRLEEQHAQAPLQAQETDAKPKASRCKLKKKTKKCK